MSIVFLSPTGQTGGAETALLEMLASLRTTQPSWSLGLIVASDGPLVTRAQALGVTVRVLPFPKPLATLGDWGIGSGLWSRSLFLARCGAAVWPTWRYFCRLRAVLRTQEPSVIHTNGLKMHVLGAWARPSGTAVLWHIHDYVSRRALMARLLRRCSHRCAVAVANSQSVAEDVQRVCGSSLPVRPIWNAVDLERFSPDGARLDLDALSGMPQAANVVRVGLVATFARWKGHHTFLRALARLPEALKIRGYVIGGPVYDTTGSQVSLKELRSFAKELGLESRVGFTGFVQDTPGAMRALDMVVHASTDPEPFGLVIAEAMACGRPVVVSRAGGSVELICEGDTALAHTPGDANDLADRIQQLAVDPVLRERLGANGRTAAEGLFSRQRLTSEFAPVYQSLTRIH